MKSDQGIRTLISWKTALFLLMTAMSNDADGQLPFQSSQWIETDPSSVQQVLTEITFDQYSSGAYSFAVSESWSGLYATPQLPVTSGLASITGPGIVGIGPATGFGSGQSGLFTGFGDNGDAGYITFGGRTIDAAYLDGLSFDVYSGELPGGLHGPTAFYVQISNFNDANFFDARWQSELIQLTPGTANAIHWDISNPDGNDANGDGIAVQSGLPTLGDWRSLASNGDIVVRIVASGANTSLTGLGLDNFQVTGVAVPEPSSCLLLALGLLMIRSRSRRPGRV